MKKWFLLLLTLVLTASAGVAETQEFSIFQQVFQGELMKNELFVYYEMEDDTVASIENCAAFRRNQYGRRGI